MTKVKFFKNESNFIKIEVSGHSGFAPHGEDIVCAAVSSIVQSFGLGVVQVAGINARVVQDDKMGYYLVELPSNLTEQQIHDSQLLFNTAYHSVKDLSESYNKYIKLEVK